MPCLLLPLLESYCHAPVHASTWECRGASMKCSCFQRWDVFELRHHFGVFVFCMIPSLKKNNGSFTSLHAIVQVERTRLRPVASGAVTPFQGLCFLGFQLLLGLGILLQLNTFRSVLFLCGTYFITIIALWSFASQRCLRRGRAELTSMS